MIVLLSAFLISCSSTDIIYHSSKPQLASGQRLLITTINGFSEYRAQKLASFTNDQLIEDIYTLYYPEISYDLLAAGIKEDSLLKPKPEIQTIKKTDSLLQIRYILSADVLSKNNAPSYDTYTATEINTKAIEQHAHSGNQAKVLFHLIDLQNPQYIYSFTVKSTINPLVIDENNGTSAVNITNAESAAILAYEKGIKKIQSMIK